MRAVAKGVSRVARSQLAPGEALELSFELFYSGARKGTEIAQVYGSDLVTSVTWMNKSLIAFARLTLAAGERRTVSVTIPQEQLFLVDAYERRVVEPGEFEVLVAPSSSEQGALRARFLVEGQAFSFAGIPGVARTPGQ